MTLDEMNQLEKPELIAEVVRIQGAHMAMLEKHTALLQFLEDVENINFSRHACGSCGLTDSEWSELEGQGRADKQWREKIKELAQKVSP